MPDFAASGFIPETRAVDAMREAIAIVLDGKVWTLPDIALFAAAAADTTALLASAKAR